MDSLDSVHVLSGVYILHLEENWATLSRSTQQSGLKFSKGGLVTWSLCFNFLICKMSTIITYTFVVGIGEPEACEERNKITLRICPFSYQSATDNAELPAKRFHLALA